MIELLTARDGSKVFRSEGRLLASAYDPVAEAREWYQRQSYTAKVKTIFVLGAGCGYHIAQLVENTRAAIVVIESSAETAVAAAAIHTFPSERVCFETIGTAAQLRALESVRKGVAASFMVLNHGPSLASKPEFFRDCQRQLIGRDWGSLNWQWQIRGGPALDEQPRIDSSSGALTIHDLEQTNLVQNSEERERMLIKALRELVK